MTTGMPDDEDLAGEYCVHHDQRLSLCADPDGCREIMTQWGLYPEQETQ